MSDEDLREYVRNGVVSKLHSDMTPPILELLPLPTLTF